VIHHNQEQIKPMSYCFQKLNCCHNSRKLSDS